MDLRRLMLMTALLTSMGVGSSLAQSGANGQRGNADSVRTLNEHVLMLYKQRLLDSAFIIANQAANLSSKWLGENDPLTGVSYNTLGTLYFGSGNLVEAASLYISAIKIWEKNPPPDSAVFGAALSNLASIERSQGEIAKSMGHFKQALLCLEGAEGISSQQVASVSEAIADMYRQSDSCEPALPFWSNAVDLRREFIGPPRWATGMTLIGLGMCQLQTSRLNAAERSLSEALQIARMIFPPTSMNIALALEHMIDLRLAQKRFGVAVNLAREAVGIVQANVAPTDPGVALAQMQLAKALMSNDQLADAELALATSISILEKNPQARATEYLEALSLMINIYQQTGRQQGASELLNRLNQAGARLLQSQGK